jgi:putative membrane protein
MAGPNAIAWWALRTQVASLRVEGLEHVPRSGPVMLVARHFHHLLDGSILVRSIRRPVHIVVGLDWANDARERRWMERACRAAGYPIVLRTPTLGVRTGFTREELVRYTRRAMRDVVALLHAGRVVLIFPEGYPNVDPAFAQKTGDDAFLPFADGYRRMIADAQRDGTTRVAVVPVGFSYRRGDKWTIVARIGEARYDPDATSIESAVKRLSGVPADETKTAKL